MAARFLLDVRAQPDKPIHRVSRKESIRIERKDAHENDVHVLLRLGPVERIGGVIRTIPVNRILLFELAGLL